MSRFIDEYQKILPLNCPFNSKEENTTELDISISNPSSPFPSLSGTRSTETSKSELIQRILDSLKPTQHYESLSDGTANISLASIDHTITSCQSFNPSNEIYIHFQDKNELGLEPRIDDLLEKIESAKTCSCYRFEIVLNNPILNKQLSFKQKQSILRILLRRQQIFDRYFS